MRDVVVMLGSVAEAGGVCLGTVGDQEPVPATTDLGKLSQILINLIGNAVKFGARNVAVELRADAQEFEVRVRDDGPGIPADRLEAIFQPFVQVESSTTSGHGGTGLGLTIARRQARLLGGDVTVESEPGRGSTFALRLPRSAPSPAAGSGAAT